MLGGDHRQYGSPDRATAWRGANGDLRSSGDRLDLAAEAINRLDGNREMARVTGLEPATTGVTDARSKHTSSTRDMWWRGSSKRPSAPYTGLFALMHIIRNILP